MVRLNVFRNFKIIDTLCTASAWILIAIKLTCFICNYSSTMIYFYYYELTTIYHFSIKNRNVQIELTRVPKVSRIPVTVYSIWITTYLRCSNSYCSNLI